MRHTWILSLFFFFNDTATTEIYTLSLHDALPISFPRQRTEPCTEPNLGLPGDLAGPTRRSRDLGLQDRLDRKSTRLNSSHQIISYAVFCLKKKKIQCNEHC